jgi:hypothetical protein
MEPVNNDLGLRESSRNSSPVWSPHIHGDNLDFVSVWYAHQAGRDLRLAPSLQKVNHGLGFDVGNDSSELLQEVNLIQPKASWGRNLLIFQLSPAVLLEDKPNGLWSNSQIPSQAGKRLLEAPLLNEGNEPFRHEVLGMHVRDSLVDYGVASFARPSLPLDANSDVLSVHRQIPVKEALRPIPYDVRCGALVFWPNGAPNREQILPVLLNRLFHREQREV